MSALSVYYGNGCNGQADKYLIRVMHAIITPELLSTYTWSGRGKGKEVKNVFKNLCNVQKLIFNSLNNIQKSYCMDTCIRDIKNKVLKYAYLAAPVPVNL